VSERPAFIERLVAPRVLVPLVLAVLVLTALLSPRGGGESAAQLTSYSADPNGARGLHDVARRLGWQVERRITPFDTALDPRAAYLVLDPPVEMTGSETGRLLDAVRAGASLLFVAQEGSPLSDSLQIVPSRRPAMTLLPDSSTVNGAPPPGCERSLGEQSRGARFVMHTLRTGPALRGRTTVFLRARGRSGARVDGRAVVLGTTLGRGRVIAVSDAYLLRNDVLRLCSSDAGVRAVRLLEWLAPAAAGTPRRLVFDEFHQGYGRQPSVWRSVRRALTETPAGRTLTQAMAAALVLLAAAGARAVTPLAPRRVERRSPIEHVGALARAYEQARASRVATRRLVRGLRRRHAMARGGDDTAFLARVAARHPSLAADVARIARALEQPVPAAEFVAVGEAVARVDQALDDVLRLAPASPHPVTNP
jgi:hypothetical protein